MDTEQNSNTEQTIDRVTKIFSKQGKYACDNGRVCVVSAGIPSEFAFFAARVSELLSLHNVQVLERKELL